MQTGHAVHRHNQGGNVAPLHKLDELTTKYGTVVKECSAAGEERDVTRKKIDGLTADLKDCGIRNGILRKSE